MRRQYVDCGERHIEIAVSFLFGADQLGMLHAASIGASWISQTPTTAITWTDRDVMVA
jgi:hypothetical protein